MSSYCKFYKEKKQVSYDNGITFIDVVPAETRKGNLIQRDSPDCGYTPPTDYTNQYLTFVTRGSGTFTTPQNVYYSLDSGSSWTYLAASATTPTVSSGNKIMWKQTGNTFNMPFSSTTSFDVEGNIMSLVYGDNFAGQTSLSSKGYNTFKGLFGYCTGLISAENLVLPATTLQTDCYALMFYQCYGLTTPPALPATTLAQDCYYEMFAFCTSIVTIPSNYLPATTLVSECYKEMFYACTSLTNVPNLPATTLAGWCYYFMFYACRSLTTVPSNLLPVTNLTGAYGCYSYMFADCSSLTAAPYLPATTVEDSCYTRMFRGCTSLTTAPVLPATTLVQWCYGGMFNGCTSLNYIKCLATDISASNCTADWVYNVASSGTFVKASSMSSWSSGVSGIPSGWSVQNA